MINLGFMLNYPHVCYRIETQRDEAIQNVLEMQESWEDYQRRSKEKYRKVIFLFYNEF